MSQCVPSWDFDDATPYSSTFPLRSRSNSNNIAQDVPLSDYEVAELTWENGQIAMHGLGPPRVPTTASKGIAPSASGGACKYAPSHWEKPRAGGTLESIVNQATAARPPSLPPPKLDPVDELAPWSGSSSGGASGRGANMDARVPCGGGGGGGGGGRSYTQVASCSAAAAAARVPSGSGASQLVRVDQGGERDFVGGRIAMTSSMGSPENASSGNPSTKAADEHDSVCHSRLHQRESGDEEEEEEEEEEKKKAKSSVSTKRSRAAAIHNQSERKRRDKINQRMKTLQKLVPNSSKTDKASMLDEVIDYLKQLQAQVQMMSRMNMPAMMLPVAMQQQLQMSMMGQMGMGMGLGMDINSMGRPNIAAMPPVLHPNPFMPMAPWDGTAAAAADAWLQPQLAAVLQDPLSTFFACQSQPMTTEAYSRMAAMYQQLHQHPPSGSKT